MMFTTKFTKTLLFTIICLETYKNKVEKAFFQIYFPLKPKNSRFFGLATFAI